MALSRKASAGKPKSNHLVKFNARNGALVKEFDPPSKQRMTVLGSGLDL